MRIVTFFLLSLACLLGRAIAFGKEDHEIFRLRDELLRHEGPGSTFYGFLGILPSASQEEVSRAYRRRSKLLHPDKAAQALADERRAEAKASKRPYKKPSSRELKAAEREASERFTRLGLVAEILRGEGRARYDHFLANGFPAWKGTGYYYERYRPGLGAVLFGLFVFAGGAVHYLVLWLGWKRQRQFVEGYVLRARAAAPKAWGLDGLSSSAAPGVDAVMRQVNGNLAGVEHGEGGDGHNEEGGGSDDNGPTPQNRRERRMQERQQKKKKASATKDSDRKSNKKSAANSRDASTSRRPSGVDDDADDDVDPSLGIQPEGPRRRVEAENGKILVVDGRGRVFLEETEVLDDDDDNNGDQERSSGRRNGGGGSKKPHRKSKKHANDNDANDDDSSDSDTAVRRQRRKRAEARAAGGRTFYYHLDPDDVARPTLRDTLLWRLPAWAAGKIGGRLASAKVEGVGKAGNERARTTTTASSAGDGEGSAAAAAAVASPATTAPAQAPRESAAAARKRKGKIR